MRGLASALLHLRQVARPAPLARTFTSRTPPRHQLAALAYRPDDDGDVNVMESPFPATPAAQASLTPSILGEAGRWANNTALECGYTGRSYTYGQVVDGVMRWGSVVQRLSLDPRAPRGPGAMPGTVAILAPNCPEYPIVYFGATGVGAAVTTLNCAYTPAEVAHHLDDSDTCLLVVHSALEAAADQALHLLRRDMPVVVIGPSSSTTSCRRPNLIDILADQDIPFVQEQDIPLSRTAVLPYSSGTTGRPKGVAIPHHALVTGLHMYQNPHTFNSTRAQGVHQEVFMGLLPFFHIYGMCVIMASGLATGAKIVTMPKFEPHTYLSVIKKHRVSVLHTVPPLLQFLAGSPAVTGDHLATIHSVMCAAAPVPPTAAAALKEKAPNPIFFQEGFGMTETLCTHMTPRGSDRLGSCGQLMPHVRAKIVDLDSGESLPCGAQGELYIKSPGMMSGYHNNLAATRDAVDGSGWFRTGDVAVCDDRGHFTIVDRIKELIKVKGLQVSPSELEDVLLRHPGVLEVGVTGVPDERAGEVPRAYVVRREGGPRGVTEQDLHDYLLNLLAPHKQLAGGVVFIDELPKNPTGKLLRRDLRQMALQC